MKLGIILVILSFIATIVSALYYYLAAKEERELTGKKRKQKSKSNFSNFGRYSYYLSVLLISLASGYLFYLIFTHQFQVNYIYQYSSRDLPFGFLLSSFWAGQEGSFLFWTLCISWLGLIFLNTARKYEYYGMFFLNLVVAFFLILLIKASPFKLIDSARIPLDGAGLNPLLQNFWMVIHPPILFVGYAAATFPFVIGLAAMIKNEYADWVKQALPWVLGVSISLGAGIIIGAFWSYETLGWGGYWGWDPVENSSLIPWLTTMALFHGLVIERRKGALKKTNFFMALITFVLVIYATFLTRSGVLADFSVHSFQDLGINGYLIIFLALTVFTGFGIMFNRFKNMSGAIIDFSSLNRENVLFTGMLVLLASGLLTLLGTSSPIISGWFGEPSQVDISFYNKVNLPVGIAMAFLIGLAPRLRWHENNFLQTLKRFVPSIVVSVILLLVSVYFGVTNWIDLVFIGLSFFTLTNNFIGIIERIKISWQNIGAPLAHFGVGLMFVGIIISASFDKTQRVLLDQGKSKSVLEYELTYLGTKTPPDGKNVVEIKVTDDSGDYLATPRLYYNQMTQGNMREPDIKYGALIDFYIAPLELRKESATNRGSTLILKKEETKTFYGMNIHFHAFNMSTDHESGNFRVGAELVIKTKDKNYNITPFLDMGSENKNSTPVSIPMNYGNEIQIKLSSINADTKEIKLEFEGLPESQTTSDEPVEQLLLEVSTKPFMNVLWLGTIIFTIGTIIAIQRRLAQNKLN